MAIKDNGRIKYIFNRTEMPTAKCSLFRLLEFENMERYFSVCANRMLSDDDAYGFLYLTKNFDDYLLSEESVIYFQDILSGYISGEMLKELRIELKLANRNINELNCVYKAFREMKTRDVVKLIFHSNQRKHPDSSKEAISQVRCELVCELLSRNPLNLLRLYIRQKIDVVLMLIKFRSCISN